MVVKFGFSNMVIRLGIIVRFRIWQNNINYKINDIFSKFYTVFIN